MRIFLVGFMGCGKSRTGRELAAQTGLPFVDLDDRIEARAGMAVSELFSRFGEAYFRKLERDVLGEVLEMPACVVATGGGTPCYHDGMARMRRGGTTVFLDPPETELIRRLSHERTQRPLLQSAAELSALVGRKLAERRPVYEQAHLWVRETAPPAELARYIVQRLPSPTVP